MRTLILPNEIELPDHIEKRIGRTRAKDIEAPRGRTDAVMMDEPRDGFVFDGMNIHKLFDGDAEIITRPECARLIVADAEIMRLLQFAFQNGVVIRDVYNPDDFDNGVPLDDRTISLGRVSQYPNFAENYVAALRLGLLYASDLARFPRTTREAFASPGEFIDAYVEHCMNAAMRVQIANFGMLLESGTSRSSLPDSARRFEKAYDEYKHTGSTDAAREKWQWGREHYWNYRVMALRECIGYVFSSGLRVEDIESVDPLIKEEKNRGFSWRDSWFQHMIANGRLSSELGEEFMALSAITGKFGLWRCHYAKNDPEFVPLLKNLSEGKWRVNSIKGHLYSLLLESSQKKNAQTEIDVIRAFARQECLQEMLNLGANVTSEEFFLDLHVVFQVVHKREAAESGWLRPELLRELWGDLNRLKAAGIAPTPDLLDAFSCSGDPNTLLRTWQDEIARIQEGKFDVHDALHVELGYTLFNQSIEKEASLGAEITRLPYADYKKAMTAGGVSNATGLAGYSDVDQAEIHFLNLEALYLRRFIDELRANAQQHGRPILVVENLTYGGVALSPIKKQLEADGVRVISTRIGSTESHENPGLIRDDVFSDEDLLYIAQKLPIVVVVDGSTSVGSGRTSSGHFPDAYQGYRNVFMIMNEALGLTADPQIRFPVGEQHSGVPLNIPVTPQWDELSSKIRSLGVTPERPKPYDMHFWTPGEALTIREHHEDLPVTPKISAADSVTGPSLIVVQSTMDHQAVVSAAGKDAAAARTLQLVKATGVPAEHEHKPAHFDDRKHFAEASVKVTPYGPQAVRQLVKAAETAYRELEVAMGEAGREGQESSRT